MADVLCYSKQFKIIFILGNIFSFLENNVRSFLQLWSTYIQNLAQSILNLSTTLVLQASSLLMRSIEARHSLAFQFLIPYRIILIIRLHKLLKF